MSGHIRFIKNIYLNVDVDGDTQKIPFGFGEIYEVDKVIIKDRYCDIIFIDGSIAKDVSPSIFETLKATVIINDGTEIMPLNKWQDEVSNILRSKNI